MINASEADFLHIDIMDGHFVPNISYGFPVLKAVKRLSAKPLDMHLMISNPNQYIQTFRDHGAEHITVHYEACTHLHRTIQLIKSTGARAGVALNPHTSVNLLEDILEGLDLILIMSVNPGYGGQKFIYQSIPKLQKLKNMLIERNLDPLIEVDGGVGLENAERILQAGANMLVSGNTIFSAENPAQVISKLKKIDLQSLFV